MVQTKHFGPCHMYCPNELSTKGTVGGGVKSKKILVAVRPFDEKNTKYGEI